MTENCPETCPNYFLDTCPVINAKIKEKITEEGLKRLPLQLQGTWEWWVHHHAVNPNCSVDFYLNEFCEQMS
jgi:hypothetical protein